MKKSNQDVKELFLLLQALTDWGDQSLSVEIGYKRAREFDGFGDSELKNNDWGFVASTKICGFKDARVSGQGKTLEEALENLAKSVVSYIVQESQRLSMNAEKVLSIFNGFKKD